MENSNTYWCAIRIAQRKELIVTLDIERRLKDANLFEFYCRIVAPVEKVVTIRKGKKVTISKSLFLGYIYIELKKWAPNQLKRLIETTNYVYKMYDEILRPNEIENILKYTDDYIEKEITIENKFIVGEKVKITDGPFTDFPAKVIAIDKDYQKIKVNVLVFGRENTLELKTTQIQTFN